MLLLGENHAVNVDGKHYRTIWLESPGCVRIIDQALLPHEFSLMDLRTPEEMCAAIRHMNLRGAGLIGCAAAWGVYLAGLRHAGQPDVATRLQAETAALLATRPTARNLEWAVVRMQTVLAACTTPVDWVETARREAQAITDEDADFSRRMGQHGLELLREIARRKAGKPVNILTHCNAGWLAFVDHGTALAPVYAAFDAGIPVHVWVDETRPRNQGAALTAWELGHHGVPHTLIPDNAGGHLMQHGLVDILFVGSDRTTANGDVANKIGTYLKALAAHDNRVPFYAVLPSSTIDWDIADGVREIVIEERGAEEVTRMTGWDEDAGRLATVRICPEATRAANYGFDVTPARLVTGIITERGLAPASRAGLRALYADLQP
jgi:methylthioribose-1-phosphate isomerase